jgi:hypothetical protein
LNATSLSHHHYSTVSDRNQQQFYLPTYPQSEKFPLINIPHRKQNKTDRPIEQSVLLRLSFIVQGFLYPSSTDDDQQNEQYYN